MGTFYKAYIPDVRERRPINASPVADVHFRASYRSRVEIGRGALGRLFHDGVTRWRRLSGRPVNDHDVRDRMLMRRIFRIVHGPLRVAGFLQRLLVVLAQPGHHKVTDHFVPHR